MKRPPAKQSQDESARAHDTKPPSDEPRCLEFGGPGTAESFGRRVQEQQVFALACSRGQGHFSSTYAPDSAERALYGFASEKMRHAAETKRKFRMNVIFDSPAALFTHRVGISAAV